MKLCVFRTRRNVGILRETYCNNMDNSEQNEQMMKCPSVRGNSSGDYPRQGDDMHPHITVLNKSIVESKPPAGSLCEIFHGLGSNEPSNVSRWVDEPSC